jgi:hypothetical protein
MSVQLTKKEAKYYTGGSEETTKLYYDGFEVLRTTSTGVKINWKAPLWRIVWGYLQYIYYSIKKRCISIIKWLGENAGPTDII